MNPKTFFVIGPNGVGKTTTLTFLKTLLPMGHFNVYDFDERGVPTNASKEWRKSETEHWLKLGEENRSNDKGTVVCGFMKPEEIEDVAKTLAQKPFVILLDADALTISERIQSRYLTEDSIKELNRTTGKTVEKFIMDNVYFSNLLRESCIKYGYEIINTTGKSPEVVSNEVANLILSI